MIIFPNAKINIGLFVTDKRADGYHNLETIFFPIPLYDALEVVAASDGISNLTVQASQLATEEKETNLVWKAYQLLLLHYKDFMYPIHLYLNKAIPMGAGMGGGSADGTFTLRLLNDFFELNLTMVQIASYALELGSDCPYFAHNGTLFASGRGELLEQLEWQHTWDDYKLLLIHPSVHISTKEAFQYLQPKKAPFDLRSINQLPIQDWKNFVSNDFEQSFFLVYPEWEKVKQELYELGAVYVSLTGTGSTLYAIFPKNKIVDVAYLCGTTSFTWCDDLKIKN